MPDLDELLTLEPPSDAPDDALFELRADELRAFVAVVKRLRAREESERLVADHPFWGM